MVVIWLILLCVLQVADIYTTLKFLRLGGKEKFWLTRKVMEKLGPTKGLVILKVLGLAVALIFIQQIPVVLLALTCLFYTGLVWNNIKLIKRLSQTPR